MGEVITAPRKSLWQRCWSQPQDLLLRRMLLQVHLWAGLGAGVYIFVVCLTGSVLVYRNELYAYFTPPPTEKFDSTSVASFLGTTNALPSDANTAVKSERSNYFDLGVSHQLTPHLTVGLDAYYRDVRHLQDEGQFGNALLYSAFNYERGRIYGLEGSANYRVGVNLVLLIQRGAAAGLRRGGGSGDRGPADRPRGGAGQRRAVHFHGARFGRQHDLPAGIFGVARRGGPGHRRTYPLPSRRPPPPRRRWRRRGSGDGDDLLLGDLRSRLDLDESARRLAPFRVGLGDDRGGGDGRVLVEHVLDFDR